MAKIILAGIDQNLKSILGAPGIQRNTKKDNHLKEAEISREQIISRLKAETERQSAQIQELREQLTKNMESSESRGYRKGYEQGRQEADSAATVDKQSLLLEFEQTKRRYQTQIIDLFNDLKTQKQLLIQATQEDLVELVFLGVQKVIGTHYLPEHDRIRSLAEHMVREYSKTNPVNIRLSPEDFDLLNQLFEGKQEDLLKGVSFSKDANVETGGFVVVSKDGELDQRLSTHMSNFKRFLSGQCSA